MNCKSQNSCTKLTPWFRVLPPYDIHDDKNQLYPISSQSSLRSLDEDSEEVDDEEVDDDENLPNQKLSDPARSRQLTDLAKGQHQIYKVLLSMSREQMGIKGNL